MATPIRLRSEEHTSELQSQSNLVCRLLLEKKKDVAQQVRTVGGRSLVVVAGGLRGGWPRRPHLPAGRRGGRTDDARECGGYFFFNDTATTEIYTLSLHDALPISSTAAPRSRRARRYPPASSSSAC